MESPSAQATAAAPQPSAPLPVSVTFSQDEASFKSTMCYGATASTASILSDMTFLRQFDEEQRTKYRFWSWMLALGIVGIVAGVIGLLLEETVLGLVAGSPALVFTIAAYVRQRSYGNLDLDDRRYEIVSGLVGLLGVDMAADAPVTIALDFRPHNHKSKFERKGKVGYWDAKFYIDRWLEMKGQFVDGTKFTISLIEKQQDRHRTKRSASGKTKHKYKTKNTSEAIISLKVKQKRYPEAQALYENAGNRVQLPNWTELKSVKAEDGLLTLRTTTKQQWDACSSTKEPARNDGLNWIAMMFLSLYQLLNESK